MIFIVRIYCISQDSSIGRTIISWIKNENSNFSPGLIIFCINIYISYYVLFLYNIVYKYIKLNYKINNLIYNY